MWVQMAKKLRINEAKAYVAKKLNIEVSSLNDSNAMCKLRRELGFGTISPLPGEKTGIVAKKNIARVLDIPIQSVRLIEECF